MLKTFSIIFISCLMLMPMNINAQRPEAVSSHWSVGVNYSSHRVRRMPVARPMPVAPVIVAPRPYVPVCEPVYRPVYPVYYEPVYPVYQPVYVHPVPVYPVCGPSIVINF